MPNGLLGCDGEGLAQVWHFISSSVASTDFQLTLNIRLFILDWSFMMNCRSFLLVIKLKYMFPVFSPYYFSLGLFFLPKHPSCSSPTLSFLKPFSLPGTPSLPYSCLKPCPLFRAILKSSFKNLFSLCFPLNVNVLVFIKAKITLLFLSNLCLLCGLQFNCEYLQCRNSVLLM